MNIIIKIFDLNGVLTHNIIEHEYSFIPQTALITIFNNKQ